MAKMAAEHIISRTRSRSSVRTTSTGSSTSSLPFTWKASSTIRASHPPHHDKNKFYKELGMFSLRKKIEDSILRAEMLASPALEVEEARHMEQEEVIREYNMWDDLAKSTEILVKLADSAKVVDALKDLRYKAEEAKLITELAEMDAINYGLFKQAYAASIDVNKFLNKYEMSKLLKDPFDKEGACITIESENEGSQIWAEQLTRMYMKWAEKYGREGRIVEKSFSESGRIKSVTIEFEFQFAYGYLSGERGVHRMVRSPHNAIDSLEVCSAAVDVTPLFLESSPELLLDEKDLKVSLHSSYEEHSRGYPVVHVQHLPTGLSVQSKGERSHFANKIKALNRIKAKLLIILKDQGVSDVTSIEADAVVNLWSQEIRRYVFYPNKQVEDVKTGIQLPELNAVLNGNIEQLVIAHINSRQVCDTI